MRFSSRNEVYGDVLIGLYRDICTHIHSNLIRYYNKGVM